MVTIALRWWSDYSCCFVSSTPSECTAGFGDRLTGGANTNRNLSAIRLDHIDSIPKISYIWAIFPCIPYTFPIYSQYWWYSHIFPYSPYIPYVFLLLPQNLQLWGGNWGNLFTLERWRSYSWEGVSSQSTGLKLGCTQQSKAKEGWPWNMSFHGPCPHL